MSKIPVMGVAALATFLLQNNHFFVFVSTSPVCRLKFSILHILDWGKVESFLGCHLTQTHTHRAVSVLTQQRCCMLRKPLKNLLVSIHLRKSFLSLNGLKDVSESWTYVRVVWSIMMVSLCKSGIHNLFIWVGASSSYNLSKFLQCCTVYCKLGEKKWYWNGITQNNTSITSGLKKSCGFLYPHKKFHYPNIIQIVSLR